MAGSAKGNKRAAFGSEDVCSNSPTVSQFPHFIALYWQQTHSCEMMATVTSTLKEAKDKRYKHTLHHLNCPRSIKDRRIRLSCKTSYEAHGIPLSMMSAEYAAKVISVVHRFAQDFEGPIMIAANKSFTYHRQKENIRGQQEAN